MELKTEEEQTTELQNLRTELDDTKKVLCTLLTYFKFELMNVTEKEFKEKNKGLILQKYLAKYKKRVVLHG